MKLLVMTLALAIPALASAEEKKPQTLKAVLLEQLKTTHDVKDWFVPAKDAVAGLTAEQASWKDGSGNHSVGQLVHHLSFWNGRELAKLKGETLEKFAGKNDETFDAFDAAQWAAEVQRLDAVMTGLEKALEAADEAKVKEWASAIAHISAHNAYHLGQILSLRKQKGWWNPENGVK